MTIAATDLTHNVATADATSFATASITPGANRLILAAVASYPLSGAPNTPTLTGNGLTWVQVDTVSFSSIYRVTLFRALGAAPSTGTITIDFAGQTQDEVHWHVTEVSGVNTSGTNGSGAVVQTLNGTALPGANLTLTLAAFAAGSNGAYGFFYSNFSLGHVAGAGFATLALSTDAGRGEEAISEWRADADTTVDATWTSSSNSAGIAIELAGIPAPMFRGS